MPRKQINLLENESIHRNPNPLQFQHPYRAVISGASGTGKTLWIMKNLQKKDSPFDRVIWVAPKFSLTQEKMTNFKHNMGKRLIIIEGLDTEKIDKLINEGHKHGLQQAVVIDDLMSEQNDWLNNLFTSGRHKNVSTIELTQRLFNGKHSRTNRLNTNYYVLFKFPDQSEFATLARQISPIHSKKVMNAYNLITDKPHGAFIIDTNYHKIDLPNNKLLKYRDTNLNMVIHDLADA
jgi:hypothetical protein